MRSFDGASVRPLRRKGGEKEGVKEFDVTRTAKIIHKELGGKIRESRRGWVVSPGGEQVTKITQESRITRIDVVSIIVRKASSWGPPREGGSRKRTQKTRGENVCQRGGVKKLLIGRIVERTLTAPANVPSSGEKRRGEKANFVKMEREKDLLEKAKKNGKKEGMVRSARKGGLPERETQ